MKHAISLRARLTAIILPPLIVVAAAVGLWQLQITQSTAREVFERTLLTIAIAIANDVAVSGGDVLSPETSLMLENASGGTVFYHVYAPDGVIVTGYATPPVGIPKVTSGVSAPQVFDAVYQGRAVRGVRLQTRTQVDGFAGIFTTTVWQSAALQQRFVLDLMLRTLLGLGAVIVSLALIVWFGVRYGLRPLTDLEAAIERRSNDDHLSAIQRVVPIEVRGVVKTLNRLFGQVGSTLEAQSQFIANAAHQLRNPIAGVLSLAEAVRAAPTKAEMASRADDLLEAARETSELAQKLLLYERARSISPQTSFVAFPAQDMFETWARVFQERVPAGITFKTEIDVGAAEVLGDQVMLKEALFNLLDNAIAHGGPTLAHIIFGARVDGAVLILWIEDDGVGIPQDQLRQALTRFAQIGPSKGSGLGLSIVQTVVESHSGTLQLTPKTPGLRAEITLSGYFSVPNS